MAKPSGSKLTVFPHCRYPYRPDVEWPSDSPGDAARFGSALHTLAEFFIRGIPMPLDESMRLHGVDDSEFARLARVWSVMLEFIGKRQQLGWVPEVALAWDWEADVGRVLEGTRHRDYSSTTETEIPLTVDVATMDGHTAVVYDWKSGASPLVHYEYQARIGALAWARATQATSARAEFVRFDEESSESHVWTFDEMDLDAMAHEFSGGMEEAFRQLAEPRPGPHCSDMYCPARAQCPSTHAVIRSNPELAPLSALVDGAIQTPAQAGEAYRKLRLIKDAVKVVEDRIRHVVEEQGPAPTAPGKALRLVTTTRETFSRDRIPPERRDEVLRDLRELGALSSSSSSYLREGRDG